MLGTTEIAIIAGVVVVLFGATAIPRFARSIGKARKEFEKGMKDAEGREPEVQTKNKTGQSQKGD